jgi:hypothetical protein
MDVFDRKIGPLLVSNKKLTPEQLKTLSARSANEKKSLREVVIADNIVSEQELAKMYALQISVPYTEFTAKDISSDILSPSSTVPFCLTKKKTPKHF